MHYYTEYIYVYNASNLIVRARSIYVYICLSVYLVLMVELKTSVSCYKVNGHILVAHHPQSYSPGGPLKS